MADEDVGAGPKISVGLTTNCVPDINKAIAEVGAEHVRVRGVC